MRVVTRPSELDSLCAEYARAPYVTLDTEFMRERTYWPILCLIQIARPALPGESAADHAAKGAAIIDPMAKDMRLDALFGLLRDPKVTKVFHAARQDLEIFHLIGKATPAPLVDTQVAAMVCGYGDQVGYETLAREIAKAQLDKSQRVSDWSIRPLSERQLAYALADVTHLRKVHEQLAAQVEAQGRAPWVAEEMAHLTDVSGYVVEAEEAWRRLRPRGFNAQALAALRELARWRELEAQARDLPRARVVKDETLLDIASVKPRTLDELVSIRSVQREGRFDQHAVLEAVKKALALPREQWPRPDDGQRLSPEASAKADLLRVLLKARAAELAIAPRLLASTSDIDQFAAEGEKGVPFMAPGGWRREAFGEEALRLTRGEIALSCGPKGVKVIRLDGGGAPPA